MINPFLEINWKPQKTDIKSFGKLFCIGALCLALILFIFFRESSSSQTVSFYAVICGLTIGILSYILPMIVLPFYFLWYVLSASIGIVISNILLTLFYYLIFSPFAVIGRSITGRDPLAIKKTDKESYWIQTVAKDDLKRYFKQY